jgi:Effector-associated domain 1
MTGSQIEELHSAICAAYDEDSLAQMLRVRLDKDLKHLVGPGSLRTTVFKLITVALQEGWHQRLVHSVCDYLPGNPALQQFCDKNADLVPRPAGPVRFGAGPGLGPGEQTPPARPADNPRPATTSPAPAGSPRGWPWKLATSRRLVLGLAAAALIAVTVAAFLVRPGCRHADVTPNNDEPPVVIESGREPSTERDRPTPLKVNEIRGTFVKKERTQYYLLFTAGPGELRTILDVTAAPREEGALFPIFPGDYQFVTVTLFDQDARTLGKPVSIQVADKKNKRDVGQCELKRQQPVIMEIETRSAKTLGGDYLIRLEGAAWRP